MSLIAVSNLAFCYEGSYDNIFENVSFQIDSNWKLGFIGRNGRGKTTFLNLLLGKFNYSGKISATIDFDYFPYTVKDKSQNTIEIIDQINPNFQLWQLLREFSLLGVSEEILYRPFDTLSSGEQIKVLLGTLFLKDNNFLLIDEPTDHLDMEARTKVSDYLKSKKGFILVSHDRAFLDNCVDHILSINKNNIEIQKGNFSSWLHNKELQDQFELTENDRLKKEIANLNEVAKRSATWSNKLENTKFGTRNSGIKPDKGYIGHHAAKLMKRSKNAQNRQAKAITEKSKLLKSTEEIRDILIKPMSYRQDRLIEVTDLSISYGNKTIFQGIDFSVNQSERIAICGKNGSGKSSLLKLIKGDPIEYKGNLIKGSNLVISYVAQDTRFLRGNLKDLARSEGIDESLFKAILRQFGFPRVQFDKDISNFSEGQKKKVLLAKSISQEAHLYLWDEPLNYIDVLSRMQIEDLILEYKPTMIFIEHDQTFIERVANSYIYLP